MNALAGLAVRARQADLGQEIFPRDRETPETMNEDQLNTERIKHVSTINASNTNPQ
jgi:hypothetical protein